MRRRGHTLVELMVALAVGVIIAAIAARLLFDGLDSWQKQGEADRAVRYVQLTLDSLAADLASQPLRPDLSAPLEGFFLDSAGEIIPILLAGRDLRPRSACWYLEAGEGGVLTLYRLEADEVETAAALPGNAAAAFVAAALADGGDSEVLLRRGQRLCVGLVSLRMHRFADEPHLQLELRCRDFSSSRALNLP